MFLGQLAVSRSQVIQERIVTFKTLDNYLKFSIIGFHVGVFLTNLIFQISLAFISSFAND